MKRTLESTLAVATLAAIAMICRAEAAGPEARGSAFGTVAQASAGRDHSADDARVSPTGSGRYGSLATGMPYDYEIRLGPNARRVAVWRLQTIRFVTAEGREFTWRFDGIRALDEFPLSAIAPAGIAVPDGATVSLNGEIPISP